MRYSVFLLLTLFLTQTGCAMNNHYNPHAEEEQLVNDILYNTVKEVEKKYKIQAIGTGVAMPSGVVRKLALSFEVRKSLSKNQLRIWLLEISNELINQINASVKVQKYLVTSPATIESVDIILYNSNKDGLEVFDPEISVADIAGGILTYLTVDPSDIYGYKNRYTETYEEALQAIQSQ
jgi:hypothetical protein